MQNQACFLSYSFKLAIIRKRVGGLMKRAALVCLAASGLTASAMVFPLTSEPYDHNKNPWTSSDTVTWGYPMAILDGVGSYVFQGIPIAPQYLVTAQHLNNYFNQVKFNGTTYGIVSQLDLGNDTMLVKIDGTFSSYAKVSPNAPAIDDLILCFGSGWSAGAAIKDAGGVVRGWQDSQVGGAPRWGVLKVSEMNTVNYLRGHFFWSWMPGISGVGSDNPLFKGGDSGGGMFNAVSKQLVSVLRTGVSPSYANNQASSTTNCTWADIFSNDNIYGCGQATQSQISKGAHAYIMWDERNDILINASPQILLNAGGTATGDWTAWNQGYTASLGGTFDTSAVPNPAPQAVYASVNYIYASAPQSGISYTASNLMRTETYKVRLHFSGSPFSQGECHQDIKINGTTISSNFDPSGLGVNKASVIEASAITPDTSNSIVIEVLPHAGSAGHATVSGIEISVNTSSVKLNPGTGNGTATGTGSVGDWLGWLPSPGAYAVWLQGTIDTSAVSNPAPDAIYRDVIYGQANSPASLVYTASHLRTTENYKVRLHFSGAPFDQGECIQDIKINGTTVQSSFDPSALGVNKASVVEVSPVRPNTNKEIVIEIAPHSGSAGNTAISGIEITVNQ